MPLHFQNALAPRGCRLLQVTALSGCAGVYLWLRGAPADAPRLLLAPIAWLAGVLCGIPFGYAPGSGYCGWARDGTLLIIEKSCSGGNFLVMLLALLAVTQLPGLCRARRGAVGLAGILMFSVLSTVVVSALRIAVSIPLLGLGRLMNPVVLHNAVGMASYLSGICLCYCAAQRIVLRLIPEREVAAHG